MALYALYHGGPGTTFENWVTDGTAVELAEYLGVTPEAIIAAGKETQLYKRIVAGHLVVRVDL